MAQEGTSRELLVSSSNRAELPTFRALDALLGYRFCSVEIGVNIPSLFRQR